uniref:Uncharacterized protein n=1 Tax=Octactis speculum TaxID=3111310 RepID=A0A7S2DGY5_9STRA
MAYLFVGLDKSDEELGIRAQNIWALKDYDHDAAFARFDKLDFPASEVPAVDDLPAVFLGSASAKDGDWSRRHPGKAAMTVLCPVRAEWFQAWAGGKIKHRGEEYRRVKAAWTELLLESMYKHWPMTKGHVTYTDLGTPLSNDFYLASVKGEVYGLENTAERYNSADALVALHPQTQIPGLYLTGQDTLNVGVVSALVSGVFTAVRISYGAALLCLLECVIA